MFKRWIFYTVIVGALPLIIRLIAFLYVKDGTTGWFNAVDLVFFGLTLSISNINELNNAKQNSSQIKTFKEDNNFVSMLIIIFLAFNLGSLYFNEALGSSSGKELLNSKALTWTTVLLGGFAFCYSTYIEYKLNNSSK
jgi:hypothetical protein